jgi:hypothetical protein
MKVSGKIRRRGAICEVKNRWRNINLQHIFLKKGYIEWPVAMANKRLREGKNSGLL